MWYKKLVNLLLIFIMSSTVLPLKQVGDLLFKKQLTEEISESHDSPVKKADSKFAFKEYHGHEYHALAVSSFSTALSGYTYFKSPLPVSPATDIHTPPPNVG